MYFPPFSSARALLLYVAPFILAAFTGCSTSRNSSNQVYLPRQKWFAHCETCNWCHGSYRTSQEAQRVVSEHNIKLHDWIRVAYYDQNKCGK